MVKSVRKLTFRMFSKSAEFSVGPGLELVPWNSEVKRPIRITCRY